MESQENVRAQLSSQMGLENGYKTDHFMVEDLLDFSNEDEIICDGNLDSVTGNSTDSSTVTVADFSNSSFSGHTPNFSADTSCRNFSTDLCVPYDDLAELEWVSNFAEESFSSEDLQKLQLISGMKARTEKSSETREFEHEMNRNAAVFNADMSVPAKARSKRSRAAPCNWTSRLVVVSPTTSSYNSDVVFSPENTGKKTVKKRDGVVESLSGTGDGRKCLHCATDNTPQWRTGPMGPKTLCNACGVRYKSGRLVPEYRPASSPTFVLTKHSNSHRKVMELRRQKEVTQAQQNQHRPFIHHHQNMVFDVTNGEDYLIHQHVGADFRQLI